MSYQIPMDDGWPHGDGGILPDNVIDLPEPDREPIFWTQADNGKAMLNFKYEGRWHRYALPKGNPYFIYLRNGEPQLINRALKKSERSTYDVLADGKAPKQIT